MIKQLKTNIPLVFAFAILFVCVISVSIFSGNKIYYHAFFNWYSTALLFIDSHPVLDYVLTVSCIISVGYLLNKVFNKTNFYQKTTALPLFIYVVFLSTFGGFHFEMSLLSDLIFALVFLKLVNLEQNTSATHIVFISGLLFGFLFLFSFYFIPLALVLFVNLLTFRPFLWREWVVAIVGMSLPFLYFVATNYILFDTVDMKLNTINKIDIEFYWYDYVSYGLLLGIIFLAAIKLMQQFKYILNVERKQINTLGFNTLITILLSAGIYWIYKIEFFIFLTPLTLLISIPILNTRRTKVLDILFLCLIVFNLLRIFVFS